ncbi:phage replisome organizer [Clostridium botulinum]|nr:phage replisome organizer [Clostridium botulinum]NFI19019.1 phage replisome organizer [Clostridium botulinum]NFI54721.1 phage replisome organizer [Clostridium botulinum]NFL93990.1 phage replisome organizer [Clostridium botulinum]NFN53612.1 phage replisome organizer [Clostridium botulinum]
MKERKFIKLRVDMYSDTKFKIIDTMDEGDLIHYIWTRLLTLAGKVNLEGALYMSSNIPYSAETLAIEFNRNINKVQLALNVFKDLEMLELSKDNVYIVKNFAKHQNIKIKQKAEKLDDKKEDNHNEFIIKDLNSQNCKLEFNHNKNQINDSNIIKDKVYKRTETIPKEYDKNELNNEVKDKEDKEKNINEKETYMTDELKLNRSSNIKSISKNKGSAYNESGIRYLKNNNGIIEKESKEIDFNIKLTPNKKNNKKKPKKPKKKSEDIEELFFEEEIVDPIEWDDEYVSKCNVVKSFNF